MAIKPNLESWKAFLLTCPDKLFFDIMRSALGDIQTPFNKHSLTKKLLNFLRKKETRERIVTLVSDQDAFLLSVLYALEEPDLGSLYLLLQDTYRYLELHTHLLNLEERLLVYRIDDNGTIRICFNPVLFELLKERVLDTSLVFVSQQVAPGPATQEGPQSVDVAEHDSNPPWLNDLLIVSVIAYLRENPVPFKAGGKPKKKTEQDLQRRFTGIGSADLTVRRIQMIIVSLRSIGVLGHSDLGYTIHEDTMVGFAAISPQERISLIAGGLWQDEEDIDLPLLGCAASALTLLEHLEPGQAYNEDSIRRLLIAAGRIISSETGAHNLINALESLGHLLVTDLGVERNLLSPHATTPEEPSAVIQPNYEVTVKPWAPFADALSLSFMAEVRSYNFFAVFELSRDSITRRLGDQVTSEEILSTLTKLNGGPPASNVSFSIDSWEKEYRSIKLFRGAVLLIEPGRQHLVEHCPAMEELIISAPAPGVYLLSTNDEEVVAKALRSCGIDQTPAVEGQPRGEERPVRSFNIPRSSIHLSAGASAGEKRDDGELLEELSDALKEMRVTPEAKADLAALIEKRLILFPEQLGYFAVAPREKTEARGFDYVGKVRIIEQTLVREDLLLEIVNRGAGGKSVQYLVKPVELKKSGTDLDLFCKVLPLQEDLKVRVRSISLVRAVRGSLFVIR